MEKAEFSLASKYKFNSKIDFTNKPILYHYTNSNALFSILKNNELWASKSNFLNDYKEMQHFKEIFSNVFAFVRSKYNNDIVSFFQMVSNDLDDTYTRSSIGDELDSIFILSFSENPDSLALWSNYSKSDGYNIGFDTEKFFSYQYTKNFDAFYLGKIIYDESRQAQIILEEIMEIYNLYAAYRNETTDDDVLNICRVVIQFYSIFFKKKEFEQEEEYRIAFIISDKNKISENVKYRLSNGSFIPYLPFTIPSNNGESAITSIAIGPKNNIDISYYGLKHYLTHNGYTYIKDNIYKSAIPLRY